MKFGVFYYPEPWPSDQWKRDLDNIAKLGFEFTHFIEFARTFIEPTEGTYDFLWLDEAIDLADKAGLKVILCTPSLTPPLFDIWNVESTIAGSAIREIPMPDSSNSLVLKILIISIQET